jgi:glutamate---cysteine ligase / carboxylate-amine ligase
VSADLIRLGASLDPGMLYYDARISEKYPTVEIRVADVCTEVDDALVLVALTRALVETLAAEVLPEPARSDLLRAAGWRASRYGVSGDLVHPLTWDVVPAADALRALVEHVGPALDAAGDAARVEDGLERLSATGNGARRQHAARERSDDLQGVVDDLVARTADSVD